MDKVKKWDATTLGKLVRGMKNQPDWPPGVVEELLGAVETRNYLANHFLREYFVVRPSEEAREEAAETLGNVSSRLDDLQEALDQHLKAVGSGCPTSTNWTRKLSPD
jgi:hypothetical protein